MSRPPPKTRVVGYELDGHFDEEALAKLLARGIAQGVITQADTGSSDLGTFVWFNGPPGKALRSFRRDVLRLLHHPDGPNPKRDTY